MKSSWSVWTTDQNILASLSGINRINPSWSYLFGTNFAPALRSYYIYIFNGIVGTRMGDPLSNFITKTINSWELKEDACSCNNAVTLKIGALIRNSHGRLNWNIVCDSSGTTSALVIT